MNSQLRYSYGADLKKAFYFSNAFQLLTGIFRIFYERNSHALLQRYAFYIIKNFDEEITESIFFLFSSKYCEQNINSSSVDFEN